MTPHRFHPLDPACPVDWRAELHGWGEYERENLDREIDRDVGPETEDEDEPDL